MYLEMSNDYFLVFFQNYYEHKSQSDNIYRIEFCKYEDLHSDYF